MVFKKFNKLTSDEFMLLQGTEKMSNMISNKWFATEEVIDVLEENAVGQWCAIPHLDGWIVYFESPHDIMIVKAYLEPNQTPAPAIHSINIADEYK